MCRPLGAGDEAGHALDATAPQRLVLIEQAPSQLEPLDVGAHDLAAAGALLGDEAGALEHGDVLLDRCKAHRVVPGQLDDALTTVEGPHDDIAPGRIREGGKDVVGVERGGHLYNHTVV
jgi:hypothetical protein